MSSLFIRSSGSWLISLKTSLHCKKNNYEIPGFVLTKLGLGTLFPARESLESDILAGDRNNLPFFTVLSNYFANRKYVLGF